MKENKGITLIALVITVIVLLILAGVSIAMLTGGDSLFKRAPQASVDTKVGTAKELASVQISNSYTEYCNARYVENSLTGEGWTSGDAKADANNDGVVSFLEYATKNNLASSNKEYYEFTINATSGTIALTFDASSATDKKVKGTISESGAVTWAE